MVNAQFLLKNGGTEVFGTPRGELTVEALQKDLEAELLNESNPLPGRGHQSRCLPTGYGGCGVVGKGEYGGVVTANIFTGFENLLMT
jgi:hypothetical protein